MLTWSKGFLFSFYTTRFGDDIQVVKIFYGLLGSFPSKALPANLHDMAWAVVIFASALALGRMVLDSARIDQGEAWGRDLRALGLGFGLLSLALLFLGLGGFWTKPVMIALLLLPLAIGTMLHGRAMIGRVKDVHVLERLNEVTAWDLAGFFLLASFVLLNLIFALGPEYFYDSLVYHLALPKLYLLHHRIVPTPNMVYSGVPFGTEMLYGLGLALGTETLAKLIHYGFGVSIAAAIYSWCRKFGDRRVALLAALLFYSAPLVCFASSVAKVELSMTFYLLLAGLLNVEVAQRDDHAGDAGLLLLSGLLAGSAFGAKYNAGLYVPVLALPLAYRRLRTERFELRALGKELGIFFGSAALASSPWLIKNWFFYHDPTYPFLGALFNASVSADVAGLKADAHARDIVLAFTTWPGFKELIAGLWDPAAHAMDGYVGPVLEIGLPWLLLARWRSTRHRALLMLLAGIWLAWALHSTLSRFVLPAVPIYCILVASAIWLIDLPRPLRLLTAGVFYCAITISMTRAFLMLAQPGTWKVTFSRAAKTDYLLHEHPSYKAPYYAGARFVNENLPRDATVLFIGEERGFYCERKFVTASMFDVNPAADLAASSADADELLAGLSRTGITHLLVNAGSEHYQRWLEGLGPEPRRTYEDLLKRKAELIFNHAHDLPNDRSWVQVYRLEAGPLPARVDR